MKRKSVLAVVAAVALVVGVSACGSGAAPDASSGSQAAAKSSAGNGGTTPTTSVPASKAAPPAAAAKSPGGGPVGQITLEKVNMPSGTPFDPYKPVKIGDVVDLPLTSTALQVTGAKTVDYDAQRDLLLVDLTLGNKGKEKLAVSSVLMMGALTSDWHSYSLGLDELMKAATKIGELKIATFDGEIPVGEARKGTAVMPVPKDAKALGFAFYPMNLTDLSKNDPPVYVGLGLKGDFPFQIIPQDVQASKAGTTYKVGDAVKAPKRAVAIQVNGGRERTQSVPNYEISVANKVVMVDISTRLFGDAKDVLDNELAVVDSTGKRYARATGNENVLFKAEDTRAYRAGERRGLVAFTVARDAKGLKLVFTPNGDDKVEFDLGTLAPSNGAPAASSGSTGAAASKSLEPKTVDASVLADELKPLPMPTGFKVVEGSASRFATNGKFEVARASLFGKMSIKDLASFYKLQLAGAWDEDKDDAGSYVQTGSMSAQYYNRKDGSLSLRIEAEQTDIGTTVRLELTRED